MGGRNRGRYLAPVALLTTIVAIILIVHAGLATKHHNVRVHRVEEQAIRYRAPKPAPAFYVVQAGNSLSTISANTGISIATLELLNPTANPQALRPGERLRLRR